MSARGSAALYTPEILALAMQLADFPLTGELDHHQEASSKVCGSRIALGLRLATDGTIERTGARITACAIGQAAAAIFLQAAVGRSAQEIAITIDALESWLAGAADVPEWPRIDMLAPARAYPARHSAILLPWRAALAALSKPAVAD